MVAELVQYFKEGKLRISVAEAEALLAGIMLDTKSFILRTGVRTFEAAAFLRRMGADTVAVRKLFASSMESYQERSRLVSAAEVYRGCAISCTSAPMWRASAWWPRRPPMTFWASAGWMLPLCCMSRTAP